MLKRFFRSTGLIKVIFFVALSVSISVSTGHCITPPVQAPPAERRSVVSQSDLSYENSNLTEDVTWRGIVLIRGYVVIAPQATVRIEPGTVVRFMKSAIVSQAPRLVVMGRIQCSGIAEKPVFFGPNIAGSTAGDWGGIQLLSTEKRNQFDQVHIEGAEIGIDSRFSTLAGKGITVTRSGTGMMLKDSNVHLAELSVSECETGLAVRDSEVDLREGLLSNNRQGLTGYHSSLVLASLAVRDNEQQGIQAEECRIRCTSCEFSGNSVGAQVKGGEGQVLTSRFLRNRETGLSMSASRLRINRGLFADNVLYGIRAEDGKSVIWGSVFSGNGGSNLTVSGNESLTAVLNWWGSADETAILSKISGQVVCFPWLMEKPPLP